MSAAVAPKLVAENRDNSVTRAGDSSRQGEMAFPPPPQPPIEQQSLTGNARNTGRQRH
jgi:hypothetical protein